MMSSVSSEPAMRLYVRFGIVFVAWKMLAKNVGPRIAPATTTRSRPGDAAEERPARDAEALRGVVVQRRAGVEPDDELGHRERFGRDVGVRERVDRGA